MADTRDNFTFEQVRDRPGDPFRPIVTLKPISGFPVEIAIPSEDGSGDITLGLESRLQSFALTENDKKLDLCDITFLDEEGLFTDPAQLLHGAVIDIAWGYPGLMSQSRRLIIRRIKLGMMQGRKFARRRRGYLVTFHALAPGIILHKQAPSSNDMFEGRPLSSVVREISQKLGFHEDNKGDLKALINIPDESDYVRNSIARAATENYMQFLTRLAREHGLLFRTNDHGLYFGPRDMTQKALFVIDLESDKGANVLGFELDGDLIFGVPAGITVIGYKPSDQKVTKTTLRTKLDKKKGTVPSMAHTQAEADAAGKPDDSATSRIVENGTATETVEHIVGTPGVSKAQAINRSRTVMEDYRPSTDDKVEAKLAKHYNQRIKKMWKLRLRIVGNADVRAEQTILLQNFGTPLLDGVWYIKECKHNIDQSGYTTELQCRRETDNNALAGDAKLTLDERRTKGLKGATEPKLSEAIVGHSAGFDNPKIKGQKNGRRTNAHNTDGDFFTTGTRTTGNR